MSRLIAVDKAALNEFKRNNPEKVDASAAIDKILTSDRYVDINSKKWKAQNPSPYHSSLRWLAENELEELKCQKNIWEEITPQMKAGRWEIEFISTLKAKNVLGPRDKNLAKWQAAELAAAANAVNSTDDPSFASYLGDFIGSAMTPKWLETIKETLTKSSKHIASRPRPGSKGQSRSPVTKLITRIFKTPFAEDPELKIIDLFRKCEDDEDVDSYLMERVTEVDSLNMQDFKVLRRKIKGKIAEVLVFYENDSSNVMVQREVLLKSIQRTIDRLKKCIAQ